MQCADHKKRDSMNVSSDVEKDTVEIDKGCEMARQCSERGKKQ